MANQQDHCPGQYGCPQTTKNLTTCHQPSNTTKSRIQLFHETNKKWLLNRCHRCFRNHDECGWRNLCGKPCEECREAIQTLNGFCMTCQTWKPDLSFRLWPHCTHHCPSHFCNFCRKFQHHDKSCPDSRVHRFLNKWKRFQRNSKRNRVSAQEPSAATSRDSNQV